jgi:hypothetical protein
MNNNLTRPLAQILISKYGGNVGHNINSIISEMIDNSLDAKSKNIEINIKEEDNSKYLTFYDDGTGVSDLYNLLLASQGKINKLGCKNQGFLDTLVYLSGLKGTHNIYTKYNNKLSGIKITLNNLYEEYNKQRGEEHYSDEREENPYIDFSKCQNILVNDISPQDDDISTMVIKGKFPELLDKFENSGTYIQIEIQDESIINCIKELNTDYFQYVYDYYFINLSYLNNPISITPAKNILNSYKNIPAVFIMEKFVHSNHNIIFKFSNEFNDDVKYYTKTPQGNYYEKKDWCEDTFKEHSKFYKQWKKNKKDASIKMTFMSDQEHINQKQIFTPDDKNKTSIGGGEALKSIWIVYQNKLMGLPSWPKNLPGLAGLRNQYNSRIVLTIYNESILSSIIMSNKSKTNIDNIGDGIIKFIDYCKSYYFKLGMSQNGDPVNDHRIKYLESKKESGIENLCEFFTNPPTPPIIPRSPSPVDSSEKSRSPSPVDSSEKSRSPSPVYSSEQINSPSPSDRLEQSRSPSPLTNKSTKIKWTEFGGQCYFGIHECTNSGIEIENNLIKCKFGYTEDDPNHRDSGNNLGKKWRRLSTIFINKEGCEDDAGKKVCEWKVYEKLDKSSYGISWHQKSKEIFYCKKENFKNIYKLFIDTVSAYV